jgi:Ser/Thr protein kinase RdoA (MazF antagonist)
MHNNPRLSQVPCRPRPMPILLDTSEGLAHWVWQTYGVRPDRMRCIARLSCEIHRIGRAEHAAEDLSLRIYPRGAGGTADIEAEMAWLAGLGDAGCRVPTPRAGVDGRLVQCRPDGRAAVLLSWVSGRILDAGLRPLHLRRVGRLVGMMHRVAADLTAAHRLAHRLLARLAGAPHVSVTVSPAGAAPAGSACRPCRPRARR